MRRSAFWLFPASLPVVFTVLAAIVWALAPGGNVRGDSPAGEATVSPSAVTGRDSNGDSVPDPTGKITVSSTAITGQQGKMLVISAAPTGGGAPLARICAAITSDPFTLSPSVMTDPPADQNPCGAATPETLFAQGSYTISAAVYAGGSQTPDAETEVPAEIVDTDISVEIDGSALSAEDAVFGDVDCDGDVDAVDALKILRHVAGLPNTPPPGCQAIGL